METNRLTFAPRIYVMLLFTFSLTAASLPPWTPGTLDIHQIQTGRGNSAYLIFPDGTTLLVDAGAVPNRTGLEIGPQRPNASRAPSEWIAQYIQQFSPKQPATLDYALITHHHDDHMGALETLATLIPIHTLLNREDIVPGRNNQIGSPTANFEVRNVAANAVVWTGQGAGAKPAFAPTQHPAENALSAAILIRDGKFKYFTGGDLPGIPWDDDWQDMETPVAGAIGQVDVLVLNHHGWLDTTNPFFLSTLQPRVIIVPAWHAAHPDHGVVRRILSKRIYPGDRDIFLTSLLDAPRAILSYLGSPFQSTEGHIVVRVAPGGQTYRVFILDDTTEAHEILSVHGPYQSQR